MLERVAISSSRDLLDPGLQPAYSASPDLAGGFFITTEPPGKHLTYSEYRFFKKWN